MRRIDDQLSPKLDPAFPGKTLERFDPKSTPANFFYVSVSGVIESGEVSSIILDKA